MGWFGEDTALRNELEQAKNENAILQETNRRIEERLREQERLSLEQLDQHKCENASMMMTYQNEQEKFD
jgi:hypothetical protein